jgi:hypothetical protein
MTLKGNVSCDIVLCSSISTIILQKYACSIFSTEEFLPEFGGSMFLSNSGIHLHDNTNSEDSDVQNDIALGTLYSVQIFLHIKFFQKN